ncbi:UNVERIFIED_CONTAM: 30S ribosomal protein S3, chloroplastic [Sesamum angustifolium]|uniref:30S ribosomal protein S3, chloroplastic n=1 Tax=Sesamum angustifolium TaxID=2727405 RepID=A0AAW2IRH6_9LAMI
MDVKTAFLNGDLQEEVYMDQLFGFSQEGSEHLVCRLRKNCKTLWKPNILAEFIAEQLKNRVSFRKAMKKAIELTEQADTKGIQVQIAGRIDGKEISLIRPWGNEAIKKRVRARPFQTVRREWSKGATALLAAEDPAASLSPYLYLDDDRLLTLVHERLT